jgi:arsenite methyltransferase
MTTLEVFDRPMCCSTGVCGPSVDDTLARFAADLEWLKSQGVQVERFNLAHQPEAFAKAPDVLSKVTIGGVNCLPLLRVDGRILGQGAYPSREILAKWCGVGSAPSLSVVQSSCCGSPGCC